MTACAAHHFEAASRCAASVGYDRRLYAYDVALALVYLALPCQPPTRPVRALAACGPPWSR